MRILIVSGAGGGSSKKSVGKYLHLKSFGDELKKFNVEYKLVNESDYVFLALPHSVSNKYVKPFLLAFDITNPAPPCKHPKSKIFPFRFFKSFDKYHKVYALA